MSTLSKRIRRSTEESKEKKKKKTTAPARRIARASPSDSFDARVAQARADEERAKQQRKQLEDQAKQARKSAKTGQGQDDDDWSDDDSSIQKRSAWMCPACDEWMDHLHDMWPWNMMDPMGTGSNSKNDTLHELTNGTVHAVADGTNTTIVSTNSSTSIATMPDRSAMMHPHMTFPSGTMPLPTPPNQNDYPSYQSGPNRSPMGAYTDNNDPKGGGYGAPGPWMGPQWNSNHPGGSVPLGLAVGIPVAVVCILAVAVAVGCCCWWRRRKRRNAKRNETMLMRGNAIFPNTFRNSNTYVKYDQTPVFASDDLWQLDRAKLVINYEKKLGSGAFCNVFKGRIIGEAPVLRMGGRALNAASLTNADVAVKMLPSFADDISRSDFMQEINFMKSLTYHPHLVSMLGWVADRKSPLLLVEYCEHGDLLHFIREKREEILSGYQNVEGLKLKDVLSFSWQIANGLEYLNSAGCIHRDIAARNVLVGGGNVCKIGDFGLCRLTDSLLYQARGGRLPLKWMAPEALASLEYSFKSDIWSYGVLLWELFSFGEVPFANIQTTELLAHLQRGNRLDRPQWCTPQVYEIMLSCWREDPAARPSFTLICSSFASMLEHATESYGYLVAVPEQQAVVVEMDNV